MTDLTLAQQKAYIQKYERYMNRNTKEHLLQVILTGIDDDFETAKRESVARGILTDSKEGVRVDLELLPQAVVTRVYNVVAARIAVLNEPL